MQLHVEAAPSAEPRPVQTALCSHSGSQLGVGCGIGAHSKPVACGWCTGQMDDLGGWCRSASSSSSALSTSPPASSAPAAGAWLCRSSRSTGPVHEPLEPQHAKDAGS